MKTHILWDHDGVLVDTEPWYFEATRRCIEPLGVALDKGEYLVDMAAGRAAWGRARARGASDEDVARQKAERNTLYQAYLRNEDIEIAGVLDVLAELRPDYAMAVVTTAKRVDFELIHRERRIAAFMDFVLTVGEYARAKPAPDPYLEALLRFDATPEQAIVIEDSERGLRSAVAAGIDCVIVENAFVAGQDFSSATYRVESIRELPMLLRSL